MQLGFVSAILADLNLEDVLKFAAAEQFDCVELMCWPVGKAERRYAGVTHVDVNNLSSSEVSRIKGLLEQYGVGISALGYYPNVMTADAAESESTIAHLMRVIEAAPLLDVHTVTTFIGRDQWKTVDDNFALFHKIWPPIVAHAAQCGVRIAIENCPMLFSNDEWPGGKNLACSPAIWRRMFSELPSDHLGLNYDPSHQVLQFMDYLTPLAEFKQKLFHLHAKDMRIEHQRLNDLGNLVQGWSTPKIPGYGDINWARFLASVSDMGYSGPLCIEVEDRAFEGSLEARKQSLRIARNVLRPLMS